jgi:hypothetical protein
VLINTIQFSRSISARKAGFKLKVTSIPMTNVRINLGALAKRIRLNKEYIILETDGISITGLMDIDALEEYVAAGKRSDVGAHPTDSGLHAHVRSISPRG